MGFGFVRGFVANGSGVIVRSKGLGATGVEGLHFATSRLRVELEAGKVAGVSSIGVTALRPGKRLKCRLVGSTGPLAIKRFGELVKRVVLRSPIRPTPRTSNSVFRRLGGKRSPPGSGSLRWFWTTLQLFWVRGPRLSPFGMLFEFLVCGGGILRISQISYVVFGHRLFRGGFVWVACRRELES